MSEYKHRWGDRRNGRLLRSLSPYSQFTPYIMVKRNESNNLSEENLRINEVDDFLHQLRKDGYKGIGMMHFVIAAYVRALSQYPGLNRYIAGRRVYAKDEIDVAMVVKRTMDLTGDETTIKVKFEPTDTLLDVYQKFNAEVEVIKNEPEDNGAERVVGIFAKMPRFLIRFAIFMLKVMDYLDLIPKSLLDVSPFHTTMFFTNVGSLGLKPVFHHLYDFGTTPIFVAMGGKRIAYEMNRKGEVEANKYLDVRFTMDERIADGFYFAAFLKELKKAFNHPESLMTPPEKVVDDIP